MPFYLYPATVESTYVLFLTELLVRQNDQHILFSCETFKETEAPGYCNPSYENFLRQKH